MTKENVTTQTVLPSEIIVKIVSFLPLAEVCNCMLVCKEWKVSIGYMLGKLFSCHCDINKKKITQFTLTVRLRQSEAKQRLSAFSIKVTKKP